jgi:hypothetical protein
LFNALVLLLGSTFKFFGAISVSVFDVYSLKLSRYNVLNERYSHSQLALIVLVFWYLIRGVLQAYSDYGILLYAIRPLQYFLIYHFLVGRKFLNFTVVWALITSTYIISKLAFNELYFPFAYNWEVAFFYGISIVHFTNVSVKKYLPLILISSLVVILSDQKAIIISIIIATLNRRSFVFLISLTLIYLLYFYEGSRMESFISSFSLTETMDAIANGFSILESQDSDYYQFVYEDRSLLSSQGDLSFHLRLRKWIFALKDMSLLEIFFGLGPGYFGGAADSSVLRLFFEVGILGIFIGFGVLKSSSMLTRRIGIFLFISGVFLDTYYSSTCLSIFIILWKTSSSPVVPDLLART